MLHTSEEPKLKIKYFAVEKAVCVVVLLPHGHMIGWCLKNTKVAIHGIATEYNVYNKINKNPHSAYE